MKRVVSVSLGSSKRDHRVEVEIFGEKYLVERIGTDGDMQRAIELIRELDGRVAAFGMGGIDLHIGAAHKRYMLRDGKKIARAARQTPILDGSGLKNTLERKAVAYLLERGYRLQGQKTFLVCGLDRFGMAEALEEAGCQMIYGDFMFALGIGIPIRSLKTLERTARIIAPVAAQLPFSMLYPTGKKQEQSRERFTAYYEWADIIAGDYHFIRRHMPVAGMKGKIVLTNTVTSADIEFLKSVGVKGLITTTPELDGRSFGTNVMEALLVAVAGKKQELSPDEYDQLLDQLQFKPRMVNLT